MTLYICMDYSGNIYISDEKDALPPDAVDFNAVVLSDRPRHSLNADRTMHIEIKDYSEIISL